MARTYNEEILDGMVRHQVGLLQYSGHVRNQIWRLLDATESDIKAQIHKRAARAGFDRPARLAELERLLASLRETRRSAWRDVRALWFEEMRNLAIAEPVFLSQVIGTAIPVVLGTTIPEAATLREIVKSRPFMGKTLRQWSDKIEADDIARIEDAVKIGVVQGESVPAISRRVVGTARLKGRDGVTQITRRNAAAIVRTVSSGVASEARSTYLEANSDLAPTWLFVATLDSRTTPICRRFDGQQFPVGKGPVFPLHFGERSLGVPVIDGEVVGDRPVRNFTQRQLVREFAKREGIRAKVPRGETLNAGRDAIPRGHKGAFDAFARGRMRELTGRTPARTSYGDWLRRQSAANQDDILGPTRGALFRRGKLKIDKFVEVDGRELTLAELAKRHRDAFELANLDPDRFN